MNLAIISSNGQYLPSVTWWIFEVSLADYNSFINEYAATQPNPFIFIIQANNGSTFTINTQINSQYQWIVVQIGIQNFLKIAWTDLPNLPLFDIKDVNTISYGIGGAAFISITHQAGADSLNIAYRPIVFRCKSAISGATTINYIPPVVYCDVYLDNIYYKSLSKTSFINNDGVSPEYEFDIQDALQEVMSYNLPEIDGSAILDVNNTYKKVYVKFRNAKYDSNGFITSEQLAPIQGTNSTIPVAGDGVQSNQIYVFNATLQHEDIQDFETFLKHYKTITWNKNSYPLTKRPKKMKLCNTDSSYFPIITSSQIACIELNYRYRENNVFLKANYCYPVPPPKTLTITNVVSTSNMYNDNYDIEFTANFALTQIQSQLSYDGIYWTSPIVSPDINSPHNRNCPYGYNFYIRIWDTDGNNQTVYSNVYHFYVFVWNTLMPTHKLISFAKNLAQVNNQGTGSQVLSESFIYGGYVSFNGIAYGDIKINSLPSQGTLTVHGWDVVLPFICPLSEIQQGNFEFWPTGSDGSQPFVSFITSFTYNVLDAQLDVSNPVTTDLQFNAMP